MHTLVQELHGALTTSTLQDGAVPAVPAVHGDGATTGAMVGAAVVGTADMVAVIATTTASPTGTETLTETRTPTIAT
jgi:hypothetical protein